MAAPEATDNFGEIQKRVIELAIRLGVLFIVILWCFTIIQPFVLVVAWGAIVAIALYPAFGKLSAVLGHRDKVAAALISLLLIGILVVPSVFLADSLFEGAKALAEVAETDELQIMQPPEEIREWPLIGERVYAFWQRAADNLPELLKEYVPQIKAVGTWLLGAVAKSGLGILQFLVAFVIAGVLLATTEKGEAATRAFATRLAGKRGPEFANVSTTTMRNVALGIVGVAIVQTALLSVGFVAIQLPAAGLAALLALVLCIIQVGPGLVALAAIIYVFSTADTGPAVLFTVWTVLVTLMDNVLKPLVFGRGASVPTLIIFLGAIGGMVSYGIIGLFVGAVVLSLGFKLYEAWLKDTVEVEADHAAATADEAHR